MDVLRIMICGSVDDGKSTLVGRLFHDFGHIKEDHFTAIDRASKKQGLDKQNLAFFTDGLRSEVEQGITIDVAYRYLNFPDRRLIVADAPGHLQYTRNMVTACSQVDAVVLMMDASVGLKEQTIRHLNVATWMRIPKILLCVNKMDLVGFSKEVFETRVKETRALLKGYEKDGEFEAIPFCALEAYGIQSYEDTPLSWFKGVPLCEWLQHKAKIPSHESDALRLSVQGSILPKSSNSVSERRWMAVIHSGTLFHGQELFAARTQTKFTISKLWVKENEVQTATPSQAVFFQAKESVELPPGELCFDPSQAPPTSDRYETELFNLSVRSFQKGDRFLLRTLLTERLVVLESAVEIKPNERGEARLKLQSALSCDPKTDAFHSDASQFILISQPSGNTVAAGFFTKAIHEEN